MGLCKFMMVYAGPCLHSQLIRIGILEIETGWNRKQQKPGSIVQMNKNDSITQPACEPTTIGLATTGVLPAGFAGLLRCQTCQTCCNVAMLGSFKKLGGANGKTKARLANRGWLDDLKHI